jgi:hypothetical protein
MIREAIEDYYAYVREKLDDLVGLRSSSLGQWTAAGACFIDLSTDFQ